MIPEEWKLKNLPQLIKQHAESLVAGQCGPLPEMRVVMKYPHLAMMMYHLPKKEIPNDYYALLVRVSRRSKVRVWPYKKMSSCINNCKLLQNAINQHPDDPDELIMLYDLLFPYLCGILANDNWILRDYCDQPTFNKLANTLAAIRRETNTQTRPFRIHKPAAPVCEMLDAIAIEQAPEPESPVSEMPDATASVRARSISPDRSPERVHLKATAFRSKLGAYQINYYSEDEVLPVSN